jgi:octaheme c-type cytochrome (tetrathionate reductase family)
MGLLEIIKNHRYIWIAGLTVTLVIILTPIIVVLLPKDAKTDNPEAFLPHRTSHTDHSELMPGPYATGQEVTQACLECHDEAGEEMLQSVHFTWEGDPVMIEGRTEPIAIGKKNLLNNFCIGIQSNWIGCTSCHAGYGWTNENFNFDDPTNIDCLVCHDQSGGYAKTKGGLPAEGVDLASAAQSVGYPTRDNCGGCHFNGGGGNGVKHADLDEHLYNPTEELDVHMGQYSFQCIDCHQTENHQISGRSISVSVDLDNQIYCTSCHIDQPHEDERLNSHTNSVACQTCHIPSAAVKDPTKTEWDWSTAGQNREDDPHTYLKIKGSFVYQEDVMPEYYWYDGIKDRYLLGDKINPEQPVQLNPLNGDINDPKAKIFPFKVHRATQPYDTVNNYLLQPRTAGEGGFWTTFDWISALELGSKDVGLDFSGQYGFAKTEMYWPITHLVQPAENALQCVECHGSEGRLDWLALGYPGDPAEWGGRFSQP